MPDNKTLVLAAVIKRGDSYLICQRPLDKRHPGRWEFPGGKLEAHENHLQAATRELREELDLTVMAIGKHLFSASDPGSPYVVDFVEVHAAGDPRLLEHAQLSWLPLTELADLDLAPTDAEFVAHLRLRAQSGDASESHQEI